MGRDACSVFYEPQRTTHNQEGRNNMNLYSSLDALGGLVKKMELPNWSTGDQLIASLPSDTSKLRFAEKNWTEFSSPIPTTLLPNPSLDKTLPNLSTGDQLIASLPSDTSKLKFTEKPQSVIPNTSLDSTLPNLSTGDQLIASLPSDTSTLKFTATPKISTEVSLNDLAPRTAKATPVEEASSSSWTKQAQQFTEEQLQKIATARNESFEATKQWAKEHPKDALKAAALLGFGAGAFGGAVVL
jgi:hypothetical protein